MVNEKVKMNTKFDPLIDEFSTYLKDVKGVVEGTIYNQTYQARRFVWFKLNNDKIEVSEITQVHILEYVDSQSKLCKRTTLQNILTSLRSFLKFLYFSGLTKKDLVLEGDIEPIKNELAKTENRVLVIGQDDPESYKRVGDELVAHLKTCN